MSAVKCQKCVVELLEKGSGAWRAKNTSLTDLEQEIGSLHNDMCVIFAHTKQLIECQECRSRLSELFEISPSFWKTYCQRSNGYFRSEDSYSEDNINGHNTWCRFQVKGILKNPGLDGKDYAWFDITIITRWKRTGQNIIISFDTPIALRMHFPYPLLEDVDECSIHDPYWVHLRLLEELVVEHDKSVWSIRNLVRETETLRSEAAKARKSFSKPPSPDYLRLHDIARHAGHSTETLGVAVQTVETMITQHTLLIEGGASMNSTARRINHQTSKHLFFYSQMLQGLKARSEANRERLQNEITLAFNTVAQFDSGVSVQIGQAAQSDSAAMKTIAFLTLAFLPATFICAVFSMTFFSFTPGGSGQPPKWSVSDKIWIYWVVAAPLTGITIALWIVWQRYFPVKPIGAS